MKGIKLTMLSFALLAMGGCEDFINTIPKGQVIPETTEHYLQLTDNMQPSMEYMELSSPDIWLPENDPFYSFDLMGPDITNRYIWEDATFIYGLDVSDINYNAMYNSIYTLNVIIERVLESTGVSPYSKDEIRAMAMVHRAAAYHALVQVYGNQYDPATASTDLGVALRTMSDMSVHVGRNSVQEVYDFIIKDLKEAAEVLREDIGDYANRPSKAAAYGLLSRVYLFMGNYDEAYNYANLTLETVGDQRAMIDYNTLRPGLEGSAWDARQGLIGYTDLFSSPAQNTEVIYARNNVERWTLMSEELDKLMPAWRNVGEAKVPEDLRKLFMVTPLVSNLSGWFAGSTRHHHLGVDVSEVYLTRAEAALRKSSPDVAQAQADLNAVRKNRIYTQWYEDTKTSDVAELTDLVVLERRREHYMTYMSFFDMKRLNSGPLGQTSTAKDFTRRIRQNTYVMRRNSLHYTYPIPYNVISEGGYEQNPGWN